MTATIHKVVAKKDAQHLQWLQSCYKVEDNRERGWNSQLTSAKRGDYYGGLDDLGLTMEEAEMLCWYVWAVEGNDEELPDVIDLQVVREDYEHTHRKYIT